MPSRTPSTVHVQLLSQMWTAVVDLPPSNPDLAPAIVKLTEAIGEAIARREEINNALGQPMRVNLSLWRTSLGDGWSSRVSTPRLGPATLALTAPRGDTQLVPALHAHIMAALRAASLPSANLLGSGETSDSIFIALSH